MIVSNLPFVPVPHRTPIPTNVRCTMCCPGRMGASASHITRSGIRLSPPARAQRSGEMRRCDGQIGLGGFGEPMMLTPTASTQVKPTDTRKVTLTARVFIEYIGNLNETVLKTDKKARTSAIYKTLGRWDHASDCLAFSPSLRHILYLSSQLTSTIPPDR